MTDNNTTDNNDEMSKDNCRLLLAAVMEKEDVKIKEVSKAIGCSVSTVSRILANETQPTEEFMIQVGIMIYVGFEKYSKLNNSEKESISEAIGSLGGGVLGFGVISSVISSSGTVAGLSATGITSGLSAIGFGGMIGGVVTLAAVPIVAGGLGYGIIKGVKYFISEKELKSQKIDEKWETKIT